MTTVRSIYDEEAALIGHKAQMEADQLEAAWRHQITVHNLNMEILRSQERQRVLAAEMERSLWKYEAGR